MLNLSDILPESCDSNKRMIDHCLGKSFTADYKIEEIKSLYFEVKSPLITLDLSKRSQS